MTASPAASESEAQNGNVSPRTDKESAGRITVLATARVRPRPRPSPTPVEVDLPSHSSDTSVSAGGTSREEDKTGEDRSEFRTTRELDPHPGPVEPK
jgi:hypothetical protein